MPSLIREIGGICWGVFQKKIPKKLILTLIREKSAHLHPPLRKVFCFIFRSTVEVQKMSSLIRENQPVSCPLF